MKNTVKKSLSAVLAVLMLVSCFVFSVSAEEGDKSGYVVERQSCTVYGDTETQRGFSWFTPDDCDSVAQVVKASDYLVTGFDKAISSCLKA